MTDQRPDGFQADGPDVRTVAIYARCGTDRQSEQPIESQIRLCRAHAEREGWSVAEVFCDVARSGTEPERPALNALLGRASAFHVVLADNLGRVSRDRQHVAAIRARLDAAGCRLATASSTAVDEERE